MGVLALSSPPSHLFLPPVPTIRTFLNTTREIADILARNITNFLTENDRIVANIDSLISSLEETHSLINRVRGSGASKVKEKWAKEGEERMEGGEGRGEGGGRGESPGGGEDGDGRKEERKEGGSVR